MVTEFEENFDSMTLNEKQYFIITITPRYKLKSIHHLCIHDTNFILLAD